MKTFNKNSKYCEPPIIISDLNGKIIFINEVGLSKLTSVVVGDSIEKIVDLGYILKLSMFNDKMDIVKPITKDFEKAVVLVTGKGSTKTIKICLYNGEDDVDSYLNDKRLFASYNEISSQKEKSSININDVIEQIIADIKSELSYCYRKIEFERLDESIELVTSYSHLCTFITGIIASFNEIEYRNPFIISFDKIAENYIIKIGLTVNSIETANGEYELSQLYPSLATRLSFLSALCQNNDTECSFLLKNKKLEATFVLTNMIGNDTSKLRSPSPVEQKRMVSYILELFSYNSANSDTEAED